MKQTKNVSLLLGRLEEMEERAILFRKELDELLLELALLKKSLSSPESPFGVVYPLRPDAEQ